MVRILSSRRGFTLVEIVIVIVIIAILAAILVPQITKWIDRAKLASLKSEADSIRLSIVAAVDHQFSDTVDATTITDADVDSGFWKEVSDMANTEINSSNVTFTISRGLLTDLSYTKGSHTATYSDGDWTYE